MKIALGVLLLCLHSGVALAEDCEQIRSRDGSYFKWLCPMPEADAKPRCSVMKNADGEDRLLCTGEVWQSIPDKRVAPVNCGWRRGKFVCW